MANTPSNMLALGTKAPFFELPNPAKNNELQSLEDLKGSKGTLVIFMCNHCPFVIHVIEKLAELYEDYKGKGIEFIAINSNDVINYPADSPELMVDFAEEKGFTFPYLYDESQAVAKAYDAACTPDFYFFDDKSANVLEDDILARLLTFNNVIVTSHQAFLTDEALNNIVETTFDNILKFAKKEVLQNEVWYDEENDKIVEGPRKK